MEHGVLIDREIIDEMIVFYELKGEPYKAEKLREAISSAPPAVIPIYGNYKKLKWTMVTDGIIIGFDSDADMTITEPITKE